MNKGYENMSLAELREEGKKKGLKSLSALRKAQLIQVLEEADKTATKKREESSEKKQNGKVQAERKKSEKNVENARVHYQRNLTDGKNNKEMDVREKRGSYQAARKESGERREYREHREGIEKRDYRESRESSEKREYRESRESSEKRDYRESREAADRRDYRDYRESRPQRQDRTEMSAMDMQQLDSGVVREGILEVMSEGFGFVRCDNYLPGEADVYVSPAMIRKYGLRTGDILVGNLRIKNQNEKFSALLYIKSVNGYSLEEVAKRIHFENLTPVFPNERIHLETGNSAISMRMMDLISPIGKGQRGMIVSQPKTGKTTLLKQVARSITANHPDMHLIVLLIDERPEEVTDIKESIEGRQVEVIYSTFDELPENHKRVSEMVLERAKRLVEHKQDVVILLDSITRLARAYNLTVQPSGRTLSGGLDPAALHMPKRFFGAARNMREGGSLTVLATALVNTGSKMDDVVFEEFK